MLHIRLLGQFKVALDGRVIEITSRPARSLLAYLILNAGTVQRREKLAGLFWPDSNETNARSNLRHALWRVRKTLETDQTTEDGYLVADEETITFRADCDYWLDAARLECQGDEGGSIDDLIEAVSLYQGELLPGFYDDWVLLERERLQSVFEQKMQLLLDRLVADQRWTDVLAWGERWVSLGHTPEPAYRALMMAHSGLGDRSSMVAVYERCVAALQQELGVEPSPQTQALYERLLSGEGAVAILASDLTDLRGQAIGPYRVVEQLGVGGMAVVYKAYQPRLDRYVALKFIKPELVNQADFRPRFEREARLLGRLNHPHIVHVYDFGEAGSHYYLAMEYVAGGTLKDWLKKAHQAGQVMATGQVATILGQVSAALDYAHQQGIIHRDLKPANVMLTPDGRALLTDFGLAKMVGGSDDLSQTGSTTGTPAYMAPEQIKGEPEQLGPASDLYSLGVVLYELLTGQLPFRADSPLALMNMHLNEPVPAPRMVNPDLPEAVEPVLLKALAKEPEQRYQQTGALAQAFNAALSSAAITEVSPERVPTHLPLTWWPLAPAEPDPHPGEPPFKGLQYFDEADADFFFGRELLTARLVTRLSASGLAEGRDGERFLAVVGASGSGKSSLVRAGLVSALKRGAPLADDSLPPEGSPSWPIHVITPTAHPLEALANSLTRAVESVTAAATLIDDLAQEPRSLHLYVLRLLSRGPAAGTNDDENKRLLVVVDQFEELFTLCRDEAERRAFVDNLLTAAGIGLIPTGEATDLTRDGPTLVVIALRADFYAHCGQFDRLREALAHHQLYIGPMTTAELRRAVEGPAQQGGWDFEPGLVDLLLQDVGDEPGALPLLSHALLETWQRRRGHTMTFGGYSESGRVQGAIAQTAERVLQALTPAQQTIAHRIFLRLTELGEGTQDTRRRATLSELIPRAEEKSAVVAVVQKLADARLITTSEESVEVAHEALIREWSSLRQWLDENREALQFHRHLTEAAQAWTRLGRDPGELYRGARLVQAGEWAEVHAAEMNPLEREFLKASQALARQREVEREAQRQRELETAQKLADTEAQAARRLRWLAVGLAIFLLVAAALALFAFNRQEEAESNLALSESQRLAAEANAILQGRGDAELAALLSLRALNTAYTTQADIALQQASKGDFGRRLFTGHTDSVDGLAFSPDGRLALSGSNDKTIRLWDIETGRMLQTLTGHTADIRDVAFSPDGRYFLTGSDDSTARLWDTQTGQELTVLTSHTDAVNEVAFSSDGNYAVTGSWDGTARLWDLENTGQDAHVLQEGGGITGIAFSPDGQHILTGNNVTNEVRLWAIATGREVRRFTGPSGGVNSVAFSPDGRYILAGDGDGAIHVWDSREVDAEARLFAGHTEPVDEVEVSPDGHYVLSVSWDNTARLWDIQSGEELRRFVHTSHARSLAFSPDGQLALIGTDDGSVRLWDVQPPPDPRTFNGHTNVVAAAKFSPDGRTVLTGSLDQTARIWDAQTGQEVHILRGHTDWVAGVAFSPDSRYALTSGAFDKTARLWDVKTGQEVLVLTHPTAVWGVAFSPDGRYIVTAGEDKVARLWDVQTGQVVRTFSGHTEFVTGVAFSPYGQHILTGSDGDATARLWDVATGQEVRQFPGYTDFINGLSFSPDGKYILAAAEEYSAQLYEAETGRALDIFPGDVGRFSLDGKYILTGGLKTAYLWDRASGRQLRAFGVTHNLWSVALSPDGQYVLISGSDRIARMWDIDYRTLVDSVCTRVLRDFTELEREEYGINDQRPTCPADDQGSKETAGMVISGRM